MAPFVFLVGVGREMPGRSSFLGQQSSDFRRQLLGLLDRDALVPTQLATDYLDLSLGDLELLGQILDEVAVGLSIDRGRRDGDFQLVAM